MTLQRPHRLVWPENCFGHVNLGHCSVSYRTGRENMAWEEQDTHEDLLHARYKGAPQGASCLFYRGHCHHVSEVLPPGLAISTNAPCHAYITTPAGPFPPME